MYIDAEGTFRPQRLLQIADRWVQLLEYKPSSSICTFNSAFKCWNIYIGLDWMVLMSWKMWPMPEHITPTINLGFCLKPHPWWWKPGISCFLCYCWLEIIETRVDSFHITTSFIRHLSSTPQLQLYKQYLDLCHILPFYFPTTKQHKWYSALSVLHIKLENIYLIYTRWKAFNCWRKEKKNTTKFWAKRSYRDSNPRRWIQSPEC